MKFTQAFASHFTLEEYVHYLQCDLIQDSERLPLRVMIYHAAQLGELLQQKERLEEDGVDLNNANKDLRKEVNDLRDYLDKVKKGLSKLDAALEQVDKEFKTVSHMVQNSLL